MKLLVVNYLRVTLEMHKSATCAIQPHTCAIQPHTCAIQPATCAI